MLRISDAALGALGQIAAKAVQPCPPAEKRKGSKEAAAKAAKLKLEKLKKDAEQARKDAIAMLKKTLEALEKWDDGAKKKAKTWFGSDSDAVKAKMTERTKKVMKHLEGMTEDNFEPATSKYKKTYGYVYPDKDDKVYLGESFSKAPATGDDSKAGTLVHEVSHFDSVSGTRDEDKTYGHASCKKLAKKSPTKAQNNADSYEYFVEDTAK